MSASSGGSPTAGGSLLGGGTEPEKDIVHDTVKACKYMVRIKQATGKMNDIDQDDDDFNGPYWDQVIDQYLEEERAMMFWADYDDCNNEDSNLQSQESNGADQQFKMSPWQVFLQ